MCDGAVSYYVAFLWQHVLDRSHGAGGRPILEHVKGGLNEENDDKNNCQGLQTESSVLASQTRESEREELAWLAHQSRDGRRITKRLPRDEHQDRSDEQDDAETPEEVEEYGPEPVGLWGRRDILAILALSSSDLVNGQTAGGGGGKSLLHGFGRDGMPF